MSYRLKPSEPLDAAVRRLSRGQIGRKRAAPLRGAAAATWVHETRKSLKRLRALLRLVRFGLAKKDWRGANDDLRDIGRRLSALRERTNTGASDLAAAAHESSGAGDDPTRSVRHERDVVSRPIYKSRWHHRRLHISERDIAQSNRAPQS